MVINAKDTDPSERDLLLPTEYICFQFPPQFDEF